MGSRYRSKSEGHYTEEMKRTSVRVGEGSE